MGRNVHRLPESPSKSLHLQVEPVKTFLPSFLKRNILFPKPIRDQSLNVLHQRRFPRKRVFFPRFLFPHADYRPILRLVLYIVDLIRDQSFHCPLTTFVSFGTNPVIGVYESNGLNRKKNSLHEHFSFLLWCSLLFLGKCCTVTVIFLTFFWNKHYWRCILDTSWDVSGCSTLPVFHQMQTKQLVYLWCFLHQ